MCVVCMCSGLARGRRGTPWSEGVSTPPELPWEVVTLAARWIFISRLLPWRPGAALLARAKKGLHPNGRGKFAKMEGVEWALRGRGRGHALPRVANARSEDCRG